MSNKVNGWALGAAAASVLMAVDRPPFEGTPRQVAFRSHMMACWRNKILLRHQWFELTDPKLIAKLKMTSETAEALANVPPWAGEPVRPSEYNRWIHADDRFINWFYEEIMAGLEVDGPQRKMVDLLWFTGVVEGMASGKEWAFRMWQQRQDAERKGADAGLPIEGQQAVEDFLSAAARGDGWKAEA